MNLIEIFSILIIHWVADFVLQTDKQAKGKSTSWDCLLSHTIVYSIIWLIISIIYGGITNSNPIILLFAPITFICHTATDYYTSRANSQLYKEGNTHGFFVSIGFDQILHYIQLFLTYYYLTHV